jgi:uncharacterized protein
MEMATQASGTNQIQSYGPDGFRISGVDYSTSLLLSPTLLQPVTLGDISQLTIELLSPLLQSIPPMEVLIIGSGKSLKPIPPALKQALRTRNIASDSMDTGAACRTYSVLASEERRVGVVLIAL